MTLSAQEFWDAADVSRETFERLQIYESLLRKWNARINLVSRGSLDDVWNRHICDSLQLIPLGGDSRTWSDLGSGGGLPGLVLSIAMPEVRFNLIESDQRKAAFLRTVAQELNLNCHVHAKRILDVPSLLTDVVSARALASLTDLLGFAQHHMADGGVAIFPKGESWESEVQDAKQHWRFQFDAIQSETEPKAVILKIRELSRV